MENEQLLTVLKEYDDIIAPLEKQILTYEVEHEKLKEEITKLITENRILSSKLKQTSEFLERDNTTEDKVFLDEVVNNLKSQITIISQEKDTTYDLWQNSLKIIDHLEGELKIYKNTNSEYVNKIELEKEKQKHALEIKELQKQFRSALDKQVERNEKIFKTFELRGKELHLALEKQEKTLDEIEEKNFEIIELNVRLGSLQGTCVELKEQLENREELIKKLYISVEDSKAKVLESVILLEAAMTEKEQAITKEAEARNEITELRNSLTILIKQADDKIENRKELIKKQYNEKLNKLVDDLKSVQNKLNNKELELEKVTRVNKMLEEEKARILKENTVVDGSNTSKLLILEKNLESTFQKLLLSEKGYLQVNSEKESIKMDMNQMIETFERNRMTLVVEKQNLERKIQTLQNELKISNSYVEEYVIQIKELNIKMTKMENEMTNKIKIKDKMFQNELKEKIYKVNNKNMLMQKEMEDHLKSEHNLNKRWKKETKDIVDKLQNRIMELKTENSKLRVKINNLQLSKSV